MKKRSFFSRFYVVLCLAFFYLPILVTMFFSFNSSKSLTRFTGFSLRWYQELIQNTEVYEAVYVSLSIAILTTIISTVLGTITAIGLSGNKRVVRETILSVNNLPIINPEIVTAIGLMLLFSSIGIQKGYITMLLAHIAFSTPYVITSVYPKVRSLDPNLSNAAMDLGATPFQALTKVVVPMIKEGIFAGALLAFTMSFDDFVISYFVTGNGVKNISIVVYNMTKRINPTINALSTIVIVVIVIVLVAANTIPSMARKRGVNFKRRRYRIAGAAAVVLLCGLMISMGLSARGQHVLKVYNAGEYMDLDLVEDFEEEYNCSVVYETFESNEMMYTKLSSGETYDILVPSDYMIQRLIQEDYLQHIDWDLIPNRSNIMDVVMDQSFDPGNRYSCPYFWGNVGILYDTNEVDPEDLEEGWEILRDPKYRGNVYMIDSERDSFMVAMKALGYSMNSTDPGQINDAYEWLISQRDTMNPIYGGDDVMDNMIAGNKSLAVVYSGDAAYAIYENEDLDFYVPEEGTNRWFDSLVITRDCSETDLAHAFINYMMSDEAALCNSEFIGYTSPVQSAFDELRNGDYDGNAAYVPKDAGPKDEIFEAQEPKVKQLFAELWTKVKAQ